MTAPSARGREPISVLYGGADLFRAGSAGKLGALALGTFDTHTETPAALGALLGRSAADPRLHARVRSKLSRDAVEDFRVDFEDGYGVRKDEEEDAHATAVGKALANGLAQGTLPPFCGIRPKGFSSRTRARAAHTLDLVCDALLGAAPEPDRRSEPAPDLRQQSGQTAASPTVIPHHGRSERLPAGFVVTLPKVCDISEVTSLVRALERIELRHDLPSGVLAVELMVETPRMFVEEGLPAYVRAACGRCVALHFGAYDYLSSLDVAATAQHLMHAFCDAARERLQLACAGSAVRVADGATSLLPVAPHRQATPSAAEQAENRRVVVDALTLHARHVRHALDHGIYQGWDLHPAQLVARYAATYAFFLDNLAAMTARLQRFLACAARARVDGGVFDDAATARGLATFFLRGHGTGAFDAADIESTGASLEELRRFQTGDFDGRG